MILLCKRGPHGVGVRGKQRSILLPDSVLHCALAVHDYLPRSSAALAENVIILVLFGWNIQISTRCPAVQVHLPAASPLMPSQQDRHFVRR